MIEGFLVVDKPRGPTSHDVVAAVRRTTGERRAGHAGTLDPLATGALVVALGRCTRLVRYLQDREKEYVARICFGVATDTLDADGAIVSREPMPVTQEELERVLGRFLGVVYQIPPMVSALKVGGRRLYRLARQGVEVERAPRPVRILQLEVLEFAPSRYPEATLRVVCGSGTYVRVLAQDIAAALGGYAHLSALRRLRVGHLEAGRHGLSLDQIDRWREHLLTPAEGIALPRIEVDPVTAEGVSHGLRFATGPLSRSNLEGVAAVIGPGGSLLAVYREGNPEVVLA